MNFEQVNTLCMSEDASPWMPFAPYNDAVQVKYFRADPVRGEVLATFKLPAGELLPLHHHTGTITIFTVQGRWRFLEHDWVATPGSVVFAPSSLRHTPQALPEEENEVLVFCAIVGELHFLDSQGNALAVENWKTAVNRYLAHCKVHGIAPRDITSFETTVET